MLLETLNELVCLVNCTKSMHELEPLCKEAQLIADYSKPEELYQIEVVGEKNRFIIFRPTKFFESKENSEEVAYIYDLLYLRKD